MLPPEPWDRGTWKTWTERGEGKERAQGQGAVHAAPARAHRALRPGRSLQIYCRFWVGKEHWPDDPDLFSPSVDRDGVLGGFATAGRTVEARSVRLRVGRRRPIRSVAAHRLGGGFPERSRNSSAGCSRSPPGAAFRAACRDRRTEAPNRARPTRMSIIIPPNSSPRPMIVDLHFGPRTARFAIRAGRGRNRAGEDAFDIGKK